MHDRTFRMFQPRHRFEEIVDEEATKNEVFDFNSFSILILGVTN
jgi:hypothetical protein